MECNIFKRTSNFTSNLQKKRNNGSSYIFYRFSIDNMLYLDGFGIFIKCNHVILQYFIDVLSIWFNPNQNQIFFKSFIVSCFLHFIFFLIIVCLIFNFDFYNHDHYKFITLKPTTDYDSVVFPWWDPWNSKEHAFW